MDNTYLNSQEDRHKLCDALHRLLADYVFFTLQVQHVHWNVSGSHFISIHKLTSEQYQNLAGAADEVAERIKALGGTAFGSFSKLQPLATIEDRLLDGPAAQQLADLLAGHGTCLQTAASIRELAGECGDDVTADMMNERIEYHETQAWILRSLLAEG